jgi:hypothetical protein
MTELEQTVKQIFVNPTVAQRIVEIATSDRPLGWSSKSNATYYKKIYADEIRPFIDAMMIDRRDIVYRYTIFCTPETGLSKQTIYNRVNQSIRYLKERGTAEDRKKYNDWDEQVKVERIRDVGVVISYIDKEPETVGIPLKPESIEPKASKPVWMRRMDDWLEDNDNFEPFVKEGLALSIEEQTSIKVRLSGLKNVQASITDESVKIIRIGE